MTFQESEKGETRFALRPEQDQEIDEGRSRPSSDDDLGFSASNRAVGITLAVGVGLMILVLMLPYISGV
ncbi:hypothetical protein [Nesterenkonia populi]|uniref:hypothetical protein n=1 Tax=Nesterenkonia populi TaxID=1591087 RepID=UPI0011BE89A2|nr:hypothetical protein [Nesterenkonia populi]